MPSRSPQNVLNVDRIVNPDVHPDRARPPLPPGVNYRNYSGAGIAQETVVEEGAGQEQDTFNLMAAVTTPAPRPYVYQNAVNATVTATGPNPVPLMNQTFPCDAVILSVPAGGANVFFGFSSGLTPSNGVQLTASQPIIVSPDNTRELWELQRLFEMMLALQMGTSEIPKYRAPRVVLDANKYGICCAVGTTQPVGCMIFYVPEGQ